MISRADILAAMRAYSEEFGSDFVPEDLLADALGEDRRKVHSRLKSMELQMMVDGYDGTAGMAMLWKVRE